MRRSSKRKSLRHEDTTIFGHNLPGAHGLAPIGIRYLLLAVFCNDLGELYFCNSHVGILSKTHALVDCSVMLAMSFKMIMLYVREVQV